MAPAPSEPAQPIWLIPSVVASALFMELMDATVISTSLPAIARDLGEDPVILKLALTSYLLSLAVFIPVSGWCADRYGARPVFQAAIAVFIAASIACAMAGDLVDLILARAVQGAGGAMMVPVGRLILLRSVPKARMISALAYLTIPALIAPIVGPLIGGYVTTYYDWRWIFWINVPFGLLGITLACLYMPNVKADTSEPLDWRGFALSGIGLSSLIFGFTVAGRDFLPPWLAPALMAGGAALLIAYVVHSRRVAAPILSLSLLGVSTFRTSIAGGGLFRLGIGAIPFLVPLMLQVGFGLDPFQSGLIIFAGAFGAILMKFTASAILRRYGFRVVLSANAVICALFLGTYALFTPETSHLLMVAIFLIGGFFRSLQFTALNAVAYADVDDRTMSQATALLAVAQQLFLSAGVALSAFVLEISRTWRGDTELAVADFSIALLVVALLTGSSALLHMTISRDAGANVSGHRVSSA